MRSTNRDNDVLARLLAGALGVLLALYFSHHVPWLALILLVIGIALLVAPV